MVHKLFSVAFTGDDDYLFQGPILDNLSVNLDALDTLLILLTDSFGQCDIFSRHQKIDGRWSFACRTESHGILQKHKTPEQIFVSLSSEF